VLLDYFGMPCEHKGAGFMYKHCTVRTKFLIPQFLLHCYLFPAIRNSCIKQVI